MENRKPKKDEMHGIKQKHEDIYKRYAQEYDQFKAKQDYNMHLLAGILNIITQHLPHIRDKVINTIPLRGR
jgi:hypothetical protein